jgi:hypothetical protein
LGLPDRADSGPAPGPPQKPITSKSRIEPDPKEDADVFQFHRGVVYLKPGSVEVQKIDFPSFRNPAGKTLTMA